MASVLAIVSRAVFEKMVPKTVQVGDVVATDRYTSKHKTFETLADGGALVLVTVRPPDERLWLVAILESPKHAADAWVGKPNTTKIVDITTAIKSLKFSTGQGITANPGALAMSLQTPRMLTADDEAVVRKLAGEKTQAARKATRKATTKALSLANLRDPLNGKLSPSETKQLDLLLEQEGVGTIKEARDNEEVSFELVDVVGPDGKPRYQLYLWPFGSAQLFRAGTTDVVGGAAQHSFELEQGTDKDAAALADAWKDAEDLGVQETLAIDRTVTKRPKSPLDGATRAKKLALIKKDEDWARAAINSVATDLWGEAWQPYPKRAFSELDKDARALVERAADAHDSADLYLWGFPFTIPGFRRFAGRDAKGPSDVEITLGRAKLPLWVAVSRAGSGHLETKVVVDAVAKLPPAKALAAWREMVNDDAYDLLDAHPWSMGEVHKTTPKSIAYEVGVFRCLADINVALGQAGLTAARKIIASAKQNHGGHASMWIAVLSLARHEPGSTELDAVIPRLTERFGKYWQLPPIMKELVGKLPKDREKDVRSRITLKFYLK